MAYLGIGAQSWLPRSVTFKTRWEQHKVVIHPTKDALTVLQATQRAWYRYVGRSIVKKMKGSPDKADTLLQSYTHYFPLDVPPPTSRALEHRIISEMKLKAAFTVKAKSLQNETSSRLAGLPPFVQCVTHASRCHFHLSVFLPSLC